MRVEAKVRQRQDEADDREWEGLYDRFGKK